MSIQRLNHIMHIITVSMSFFLFCFCFQFVALAASVSQGALSQNMHFILFLDDVFFLLFAVSYPEYSLH